MAARARNALDVQRASRTTVKVPARVWPSVAEGTGREAHQDRVKRALSRLRSINNAAQSLIPFLFVFLFVGLQ